jgi:hypothetical protein
MKRFYAAVVLALASLLVSGCTPDDAKAAKSAATTLRLQVDAALKAYKDLLLRAILEPAVPREELMSNYVALDITRATGNTGWTIDKPTIEGRLQRTDWQGEAAKAFYENAGAVVTDMKNVEDAATYYEAAWPLGSQEFVCLKGGVLQLAKNLGDVAGKLDPNGALYKSLDSEKIPARRRYQDAVRAQNAVTASAALHAYDSLLIAEAKANTDTQAAFVRAATAATELYSAIEAIESVSVSDILVLIQTYGAGVSKLDDSIDGEAIAKKAGVVLGKVGKSKWLAELANKPLPKLNVKCKIKS